MIALEIIVMAAFYATYEKLIIKDVRTYYSLWFVAGGNTALILLIPYLISSLYFAWQDKKRNLEKLMKEKMEKESPEFISFYDEKDALRLTLKSSDLFYLESSDNYVTIYYSDGGALKKYLLRNSLKRMEVMLRKSPVVRCHRSFMVNINQIKAVRKGKKGYEIELNLPGHHIVPVTKTYEPKIKSCFKPG
jgi:DNA-binding LytR/AlgR family response regulator